MTDVDEKKHVKIRTVTENPDGSLTASTESYFETLSSIKEEVIKQIKTDRNNLLSDIISCLDVVTAQKTKELTLMIYLDEFNQPSRIVKQYTTKKENYNKR